MIHFSIANTPENHVVFGLTLCSDRMPVLTAAESFVNVAVSASSTKRVLPVRLPDAAGAGAACAAASNCPAKCIL